MPRALAVALAALFALLHAGRRDGAGDVVRRGNAFGMPGLPAGAVVGGPAPRSEVRGEGFRLRSPFDSRFATYEDRRVDYVTSEPAIDYTASSILLIAALEGRC